MRPQVLRNWIKVFTFATKFCCGRGEFHIRHKELCLDFRLRASHNLNSWRVAHCSKCQQANQMTNAWFLISEAVKEEVGAIEKQLELSSIALRHIIAPLYRVQCMWRLKPWGVSSLCGGALVQQSEVWQEGKDPALVSIYYLSCQHFSEVSEGGFSACV